MDRNPALIASPFCGGDTTIYAYSKKAEYYARYRWSYAPEATETIFSVSGLTADSTVADVGAGTGILTKQLVRRVRRVYAVEPDAAMLAIAERDLGKEASFKAVLGRSDATTLAARSVDLITVAQALHWFEPKPTRREFLRILKPGGWLAILWNHPADQELQRASAELYTEACGWNVALDERCPAQPPLSYYYGHERYLEKSFPFSIEENWESFLGSFLTDARAPDEDDPGYPNLEACQRKIAERFSVNGRIKVSACTQLVLGQMGPR